MRTLLTSLLLIMMINDMHSQVGSLQWQHPRGGSQYDYVREIDPTMDGGSVSAGYTESNDGDIGTSFGSGDCMLIRSAADGSLQWERTFGGSGFDFGYSVRQTNDGAYIYAGYTESTDGDVSLNHGGGDCWIIRLDPAGNIDWEKTYGGSGNDNAQCVRMTADGGFIFCGYTESSDGDVTGYQGGGDCWVVKLSAAGTMQWQKTIGGSSYDYAQDIRQTADGGYILTGGTNSGDGDVSAQKGNGDGWLVKLDASGEISWEKTFGGSDYEFLQMVEEGIDGGYVLTGYTQSNDGDVSGSHGNGDCWVVKCDSLGTLQWQRSLGSSGSDYGFGIRAMSGVYILTGYAEMSDGDVSGNKGNYDCWVVLMDENGGVNGQRCFGGSGVDIGYSVRESGPGSFLIAGYTESNDGDVSGYHAGGDSWILKVNFTSVGVEDQTALSSTTVFPNPGNGQFTFLGFEKGTSLNLFDAAGKLIHSEIIEFGTTELDLSAYAKGVYYYTASSNGSNKNGKLIIQ